MEVNDVLLELFGRVPPLVAAAVDGLGAPALAAAPAPGANPIGWLTWHLARVQDHHVSELRGDDQAWVTGEWAATFGLDPDPTNIGYGHSADEVRAVRPRDAVAIVEYLEVVQARSRELIAGLGAVDLDRVVDRRWDPPVTMGVRLVSVADDCLQHAGQAAYVRGLLDRA